MWNGTAVTYFEVSSRQLPDATEAQPNNPVSNSGTAQWSDYVTNPSAPRPNELRGQNQVPPPKRTQCSLTDAQFALPSTSSPTCC